MPLICLEPMQRIYAKSTGTALPKPTIELHCTFHSRTMLSQTDLVRAQVLGRGICNGCWNVRSSLQSECGRCKVGACKACREQWARQRRQGTHANDAGLLVHQANVCFCGAHLTPRGAALYDRKVGIATHHFAANGIIAAATYEHINHRASMC